MMLHCLYIVATSNGNFVSVFDMTGGFTIQSQEFEKSGCLEVLGPLVDFHVTQWLSPRNGIVNKQLKGNQRAI